MKYVVTTNFDNTIEVFYGSTRQEVESDIKRQAKECGRKESDYIIEKDTNYEKSYSR